MALFDGKVVWMTGAGTGIGRAGAIMFAAEGASVALLGRRREKLEEVASEIESAGGRSVIEPLDVGDRERVGSVTHRLLEQLGSVDILVNNAGTNVEGDGRLLENLTPDAFDEIIRINLTGQYNMFMAAFAPMREQGEGLVINIISTAAKAPSGVAGMSYQTAKYGMMGFGVSLNKEAWKFGIRTCNIFPDETNTEIIQRRSVRYAEEDLQRILQPEDFAHTLKYVASLHPRASVTELTMYPTRLKYLSDNRNGDVKER